MAGHGLRYLALEAGLGLEAATFLGGLAVGAIAAWVARSGRAPVAVIAFAGAVTMIPGLSLYRALGGAVQLARQAAASDPDLAAGTLGSAFQGGLVVGALALGFILGARLVGALVAGRDVADPPRRGRGRPERLEEAVARERHHSQEGSPCQH
jgi:uncharacterized membrane protein YjjB (DUF3815 family)